MKKGYALLSLLALAFVLLALPLAVYLSRQTTVFKNRAAETGPSAYNYIYQFLSDKGGYKIYTRICPIDSLKGILWNQCSSWNTLTPRMLGLNTDQIGSVGGFSYVQNGKQTFLQAMQSFNGTYGQVRYCPIDENYGPAWDKCSAWSSPVYSNAIGLGDVKISHGSGIVYVVNGKQTLLQALTSFDGTAGWARFCPIDDFTGIQWGSCTSWAKNLSSIIGLGSTFLSGSNSGVAYFSGGSQTLILSLTNRSGDTGYVKTCPVDSTKGVLWGNCSATWSSVASSAIGLGNVLIGSSNAFAFTTKYPVYLAAPRELSGKVLTAINTFLALNPIENLPGRSNVTIGQIYQSGQNIDQRVHQALELICGPEPAAGSNLETFSAWRTCAAVGSINMLTYHALKNQNDWVTAYTYAAIFQMDSLAATDGYPPYHNLSGNQYRLGNTIGVKGYLNDFGMGVFSYIVWQKPDGRIAQSYCTSLEFPYDSGKNCKTIDLFQRIRLVATNVITESNNYPSFRQDPGYLSRNAAGRAVAARLTGNPALISQTLADVNQKTSVVFGTTVDNPLPVSKFGYSDLFQHLYVALSVNDWNVPSEFRTLTPVWQNVFFKSYFDKNYPVADITANSYLPKNIQSLFPQAVVTVCGQPGIFHTTTAGRTLGQRGENLSDALITIGPELYVLLKQSSPDMANEVLTITSQSLDAFIKNPPNWRDELCDPAEAFGFPKNQLVITLRIAMYPYLAYKGFLLAPVVSF